MIVDRLVLTPYEIPFAEVFSTAARRLRARRGLVVELETEVGVGLGDMAPHPGLSDADWQEFLETAQRVAAGLVGARLGPPEDMDWVDLIGESLPDPAGSLAAGILMGLDMALHDLASRAAGVSLARFLNAKASDRVVSSALLPGHRPIGAAQSFLAEGYRVAKCKADPDPQKTQRNLLALRQAVPGLRLRLDVNGAWSRATAVEFCRQMPADSLEWIEQPVAPGDLAGLRAVRETGVRVAADEGVCCANDVSGLAAEKAADVIVLKLMQVGGIAAASRIALAASQHRLEICLTTGMDSSIATAAALHLSAALHPDTDSGFSTLSLLQGDLVLHGLREGPWMEVPEGPGLGVTLDRSSRFLGTSEVHGHV
jgi:o-succinylbenzoate synthase